jgi:predicted ribosomally synthesized peptide with nif11-like leader
MPTETVKKFLKQAESTPELQSKIKAVPKGPASIKEVVKIASAAGFSFTEKDYEDAVEEMLAEKHAAGALSDSELALISGGLMCVSSDKTKTCTCCPSGGVSLVSKRSATQVKTTLG